MRLDTSLNGIASVCGTLLGLTTLSIILRFVSRYKQRASILIDDWAVASAWVSLSYSLFAAVTMNANQFLFFHARSSLRV
jgi:hypothetical protein